MAERYRGMLLQHSDPIICDRTNSKKFEYLGSCLILAYLVESGFRAEP